MVEVSVVMPTYNTSIAYLQEAVESVLNQTFSDFEFIIIDDASNDVSVEYLNSLKDKRITVIHNKTNLGVTKSLNIGLNKARGKYIARMDSDDISLPNRFEKQVEYLDKHPNIIVCGSQYIIFGESIKERYVYSVTADQDKMRMGMLFGNHGPAHPSVMFNSSLLRKNNILYDERLKYAQDYAMWVTCAYVGEIHIVPEILFKYRVHSAQISTQKANTQEACAALVRNLEVNRVMGTNNVNYSLIHEKCLHEDDLNIETILWLISLIKANNQSLRYPKKKFREYINDILAYDINYIYSRLLAKKKYLMLFSLVLNIPLQYHYIYIIKKIKRICDKVLHNS